MMKDIGILVATGVFIFFGVQFLRPLFDDYTPVGQHIIHHNQEGNDNGKAI